MRWMPATPTSVRRATLLRKARAVTAASSATGRSLVPAVTMRIVPRPVGAGSRVGGRDTVRSGEHTSELQSHSNIGCRLLLEKKNKLGEHLVPLSECIH